MSGVELLGNRANGKDMLVENGKLEIEESKDGDYMDVDCGWDCKGSYELYFLKKVLSEDMSTEFSDNKLVILAVHAVLLDSGFVVFDPESRLQVDFFDILKDQSSMSFTPTVNYTLPQLISSGNNGIQSILLRFQTLGDYVNVYGSLFSSSENMHKLSIEKTRIVPAISQMDSTKPDAEEVIFEFWRIVKDGLALHLMIDLCEKAGLNLPPCLMGLPGDLKFQILKLLSGEDTGRVASVCKEFRYLSANEELWKEKYMTEYGNRTVEGEEHGCNWKARFVISCVIAKERKKVWSRVKNRVQALREADVGLESTWDELRMRESFGGMFSRVVEAMADLRALSCLL